MSWRPGPNGTYIHPRGGHKPKQPPDGYEVTKLDPYVATPVLEECQYREVRTHDQECCGGRSQYYHCNALQRSVRAVTCMECGGCQEWIERCLRRS